MIEYQDDSRLSVDVTEEVKYGLFNVTIVRTVTIDDWGLLEAIALIKGY